MKTELMNSVMVTGGKLMGLLGQTTVPLDPAGAPGGVPTGIPGGIPGVPATGPVKPELPWFIQVIEKGGILIPAALFFVVFYFIVIRGKKKQEKERQALLDNVKKGDMIETIGGEIGTVVSADEKYVVLKVDENTNTKMKFNRRAIHRVMTEEKADK